LGFFGKKRNDVLNLCWWQRALAVNHNTTFLQNEMRRFCGRISPLCFHCPSRTVEQIVVFKCALSLFQCCILPLWYPHHSDDTTRTLFISEFSIVRLLLTHWKSYYRRFNELFNKQLRVSAFQWYEGQGVADIIFLQLNRRRVTAGTKNSRPVGFLR
jgi:hypothetical protein